MPIGWSAALPLHLTFIQCGERPRPQLDKVLLFQPRTGTLTQ